jgi:nitrogen fixation protein NifB
MPAITYAAFVKEHPCYGKRPANKGRIHLPVSPGCNISCRFCARIHDGSDEQAQSGEPHRRCPGLAQKTLTPEQALQVLARALKLCPEITVAGIAGPGDPLATPYAIQTFRLVDREFPQLLKCLSTNGLALPEKLPELLEVKLNALTVTVNAIDQGVLAQICAAPPELTRNQLLGIEQAVRAGIHVKVNTVLVPGVNDGHIEEIARAVAKAGARLYNIIPLIPRHGLAHLHAPSCEELQTAREAAENYIEVFRHCRHCRADAAGILGGDDFAHELYGAIEQEHTFSHG